MPTVSRFGSPSAIPRRTGIGLRTQHFRSVLGSLPDVGWLEVHSENFFGAGGQPLYYLERIRNHYPISLHGVGLSLGAVGGPTPPPPMQRPKPSPIAWRDLRKAKT